MYISKISIQNFRNYRNFTMDLKPFVTIIGENNIGKSNLLDAISLVLSRDIMAYRRRALEVSDFNFDALKEFKASVKSGDLENLMFPEVRVDLYFFELDTEQEAVLDYYWVDKEHSIARISYVYAFKSSKRKEVIEQYRKILIEKGDDEDILSYIDLPIGLYEASIVGGFEDHAVDSYDLTLIKMEYLDALRDAKKELNSNSDKKLLFKILNDRDQTQFADIKEKVLELDRLIKQDDSVLQALKHDIALYLDRLSLVTETSTNQINFQFSSIELSDILKKIGMQYGDEAVSIEKNGLGRNNLLYIAVVLAHLYEKQNNYFRLIAIEEPEAHLCPIVQRHLAKNIVTEDGSGKQQIIITTHSTHIASYLNLDSTVILFKKDGHINSHYLLEGFDDKKSDDKKVVRYLQKWLNATNSTMFFSRKLILVEGIAEEILIPVFYQWKYGKTLEKINCQVVNVNGVAFKNFLRVIENGYFVKTAVLTDCDCGKKTQHRASELKAEYDSNDILINITHLSTFEKELFDVNKTRKANRELLLNILKSVRPQKCGQDFCDKHKKGTSFNIEELFKCIEEYKSEFAFELANELEEKMAVKGVGDFKKFVIPKYIEDAFEFINGE